MYKLTQPKVILNDPDDHLLGPLGIIAFFQKEHSDLLAEKKCPALSAIAKLQTYLATSSKENENAGRGRHCYIHQDPGHLANQS